nr:MAG: hypothetical protein DiTV3a_F2ORF21 [Diabrotica toursvirus 3a]
MDKLTVFYCAESTIFTGSILNYKSIQRSKLLFSRHFIFISQIINLFKQVIKFAHTKVILLLFRVWIRSHKSSRVRRCLDGTAEMKIYYKNY